jgi:hypothetical protein
MLDTGLHSVNANPQNSVTDPGSKFFHPGSRVKNSLTPGSGIGFFRISDPVSQTYIFEGLVTIFWVKTSIILGKLGQIFLQLIKNIIIFSFVKFVATKNGLTKKKFSPLSFIAVFGSEIRDPGWVKIRIRDKHPGSATLVKKILDPETQKIFFKLSEYDPGVKRQYWHIMCFYK